MKCFTLIMLAVTCAVPLFAQQQSVIINEPAGYCYQDLKAHLPEAIRWDDEQMMVTSRPLLTTLSGTVEVVARVFPEHRQDKKKNKRVEMCKIVVYVSAPERSAAWNSANSSWLFRNALLMKARVESAMKARERAGAK